MLSGRSILAAVLVAAMVGVAEMLGEREIIFPEAAAILVGFLVAPRMPWRTTAVRVFISLSVCAALGSLVAMITGVPIAFKLALAYMFAQGVLFASGTTLAPMISAAVLPVMLGAEGWVYPVSAITIAAVCCLVRSAFEARGIVRRDLVRPHPGVWGGAGEFAMRSSIAFAIIVTACAFASPLVVAPPLLVAFTQMTRRRNPLAAMPFKVTLVVAACALIGCAMRYASLYFFALPSWLAAAMTMMLVALLFKRTRLFFPPAAALAILPFLIDSSSLAFYPLYILAGQLSVLAAAKLFRFVASGRKVQS